jgi:hypothetical protein
MTEVDATLPDSNASADSPREYVIYAALKGALLRNVRIYFFKNNVTGYTLKLNFWTGLDGGRFSYQHDDYGDALCTSERTDQNAPTSSCSTLINPPRIAKDGVTPRINKIEVRARGKSAEIIINSTSVGFIHSEALETSDWVRISPAEGECKLCVVGNFTAAPPKPALLEVAIWSSLALFLFTGFAQRFS